jgi:tetratricopeptide (TPR) repeat protein
MNTVDFYNRAIMLYYSGDYAEAIQNFENAVNLDDKLADAWLGKGSAFEILARYDTSFFLKAIDSFDKCIEITLGDKPLSDESNVVDYALAAAWFGKGRIYGNMTIPKYNEAVVCFDKAQKYMDHSVVTDRELADIWRNKGYAISVNGYTKNMLNNSQELSREAEGNFEKGKSCLEEAIKTDPQFALAFNTMGYIHVLFGKYDESIEFFDRALKIDPFLGWAWRFKGYSIYAIKKMNNETDFDQAKDCFDKAIRLDEKSPHPWHYKGYVYFELGNHGDQSSYEEAIRCFDEAIQKQPDLALAWYNKGISLDRMQKYDEAINYYDQAISYFKGAIQEKRTKNLHRMRLASVYNSKGTSLDSLGGINKDKYDQALRMYDYALNEYRQLSKEGVNCDIEIVLVRYNQGYTLGNKKKYYEAIKAFDEVINYFTDRVNPDDYNVELADALRNQGFAYSRLDTSNHMKALDLFKKSVEHLRKAINKDKNNLNKKKKLALALNSQGYHIVYYINDLLLENEGFDKREQLYLALKCFDEALDIFIEIDDKDRYSTYAYYNKGYALHLLGMDNELILKCFDDAVTIMPNFADAWYSKGVSLYRIGDERQKQYRTDYLDAIANFAEAIECFNEAISYFERKRENLKQADRSENQNYASSWYNKGIALNYFGEYEEALGSFENALRINRDFVEPYLGIGIVLLYLKRNEEATKYFEQAINRIRNSKLRSAKNKDDFEYWRERLAFSLSLLGVALYYSERYQDALKCFKSHESDYKRSDSYRPYFLYIRGQCKYNVGDFSGAADDFRKIITDGDTEYNDFVYNNLGLCYYRRGKLFDSDAQDAYRNAIESNSRLGHAYFNLAVLFNRKNQITEAKQYIDDCLANSDRKYEEVIKKASEAKMRYEASTQFDWYSWWFGQRITRKVVGAVLIVMLIGFISVPLLLLTPVLLQNSPEQESIFSGNVTGLSDIIAQNVNVNTIAWWSLSIGILLAVLLLPSLSRFRAGTIELDITPPNNVDNRVIDLNPLLVSVTAATIFSMPITDKINAFRVPLELSQTPIQLLHPIEPNRMPVKYHWIKSLHAND